VNSSRSHQKLSDVLAHQSAYCTSLVAPTAVFTLLALAPFPDVPDIAGAALPRLLPFCLLPMLLAFILQKADGFSNKLLPPLRLYLVPR